MLQLILIPCFQNAFDSGHGKELIGGPAAPDQDNPDNIISVFINKVCCILRYYILSVFELVLATTLII